MITTTLRHTLTVLAAAISILFAAAPAAAQTRMTDEQLQKALTEVRNYKHRMLASELDLDKDTKDKFFEIYDAMDDELMAIGVETRDLERRTLQDENATDTECSAVARTLFEVKKRESEVELKYYDRLNQVLTPRQMLRLKGAERKINMRLAKYHGRHAARKQRAGSQK